MLKAEKQNDILDFSKIEAKRLTMCPEPFPIRACVNSAIDLLKTRAQQKGLALSHHVTDDVPETIIQDVVRFKQILINLLSNAISTSFLPLSVQSITNRKRTHHDED